jgi:hypothetical protein
MHTEPTLTDGCLDALTDLKLELPRQVLVELGRVAEACGQTLDEAMTDALEAYLHENPPVQAQAN